MEERIFISYKRVDKERVFKLKEIIERETKEKCWIDLDGIESDEQFGYVIANAIEKAEVFLFMYSHAHSIITDFDKDWTIREINYAQNEKKRIVFVNMDGTPLTKWFNLVFGLKQQVDARSGDAVKKLLQDLKKWLSKTDSNKTQDSTTSERKSPKPYNIENDDDFETAEVLFEAKEYNDAIQYYLLSAEKGNKIAQERMCQFFYDSRVAVEDISNDIWEKITELTKMGESYAFFLLHCRYYYDSSAKQLSFDLIRKATLTKDVPLAFLRLGQHYGWGLGTKQNHILAMHNYMKAFDMGCKEACGLIGSEYEYGSTKMPKDLDKAIEYYKKGAELKDRRSMTSLARIYFYELNKIDEAKGVAQQMIEYGIYRGYILMGEFCATNPDYTYNLDNLNEAKKWYREALLHDENEGYSALAGIYWDIDDNHKEAYILAKQGYRKHDSSSIRLLGYFSCIDGELEKSWNLFKEAYDKYGNCTNQLGWLFFEKNFRKDNKEEEELLEKELETILTLGAHNGEIDCLKYLIRLHSLQEFGQDVYDFETFKNSVTIQEDIRLGAELYFPEMMFYYGRLLLEESYFGYNPAKGAYIIFQSATNSYQDAIKFLLDYKKNGIGRDDVDLEKIFTFAITQKFLEEDYLEELIQYGENNEKISTEFKEYLKAILNEKTVKIRTTFKALNSLLSMTQKGESTLDDNEIIEYKKTIDLERSKGNLGYLSILRQCLHLLYKEYDEKQIFTYYSTTNDTQRQLFYAANYANDKEIDISQQDEFLEKLHELLRYDSSLALESNNYNNDIKELMQAIVNYQSSYRAICKKRDITPLEYNLPKSEYLFPYMPSSICSKISYDTFNLFLTLRDYIPDIFDPMLPIIRNDEQMLNYIEKLSSDQDLQLFLIELVEIKIDLEAVMLNNYALYKNYKENNKKTIVEYLNNFIEKYKDDVTANNYPFTEENLPDFSKFKPNRIIDLNDVYQQDDAISSKDTIEKNSSDNEEFERLLDEFINSSANDEDSHELR